MIRHALIELYKKSGIPPSQEEVASHTGITIDELRQRLDREPPLPNLHDVSFSDARKLIDHYGPELLFSESAVSDVKAYFAHRAKIEAFEKKAQRKSDPPPPSDEE
jgi:hypothetical protein